MNSSLQEDCIGNTIPFRGVVNVILLSIYANNSAFMFKYSICCSAVALTVGMISLRGVYGVVIYLHSISYRFLDSDYSSLPWQ